LTDARTDSRRSAQFWEHTVKRHEYVYDRNQTGIRTTGQERSHAHTGGSDKEHNQAVVFKQFIDTKLNDG